METLRWRPRQRRRLKRADSKTMPERTGITVRKTFTLSELDLAIIKAVVKKCGFLSDSEAIRAMIKYFADNAPCVKTAKPDGAPGDIRDRLLKDR